MTPLSAALWVGLASCGGRDTYVPQNLLADTGSECGALFVETPAVLTVHNDIGADLELNELDALCQLDHWGTLEDGGRAELETWVGAVWQVYQLGRLVDEVRVSDGTQTWQVTP